MVEVRVNMDFGTIGWFKNSGLMYGMQMHERIMQNDIYPVVSLFDKKDCV